MDKIGIMGGTFNPVHIAHLVLAEQAYQQYDLDKIIFMPSYRPPHKDSSAVLNDKHRLAMLKLAIQENSHFTYSTLEIDKEDTSYTCDTLRILMDTMPDTNLYFIIGGDSLCNIENWYHPELIFKRAHILASSRYAYNDHQIDQAIESIRSMYNASIDKVIIPSMEISSQHLRTMIAEGKSVKYLVPDLVIQYIEEHHLYDSRNE